MAGSLSNAVLDVARRQLAPERLDALPHVHSPLRDAGISSLALVALIADLEQTFDVTFPSDALDDATFQSAETVAAALAALGAQSPV